jgi:uncharacterized surface protein with fasciclin (FAS1) repeats
MRILLFIVAFVCLSFPVMSQEPVMTPDQLKRSNYKGSVFDLLQFSKHHKLFVMALKTTGLDNELQKKQSWTVMAPTDGAFAKLSKERVRDMFEPENRAVLKGLMQYHIQKGGLLMTAGLPVGASRFTVMNGNDIVITKDTRGVMLNGAYMVETDIPAANGIVHFIDHLIIPEGIGKAKEKIVK